tara:strand:+ start:1294 stop:2022 length:729 start_codon:yes stop_codon:yes gene_type:complete
MGYFAELPDLLYQSPLLHKNSSGDYILIKNLFRRTKLQQYLSDSVTMFNKFVIGDGDRPDTIADAIFGDPRLDYIVVLVAGITNIHNDWPLQDYQVYDHALRKYGSEEKMNEIHHYETFEIRDDQARQILPPDLIVDKDFKIDGTAHKFPSSTRYTIRSDTGYRQLDDKDEFSVLTDNIATAVTNLQYEYMENEKKRKIDVLKSSYLQLFINDLRDIVRYDKNSAYITSSLVRTENTNTSNP